jgi:hypothetical protein
MNICTYIQVKNVDNTITDLSKKNLFSYVHMNKWKDIDITFTDLSKIV